jgi:hypothetical protein
MKTSVVFTVLATWATLATASYQPPEKDSTTTLTSTITVTSTITECPPEVPDCPANKPAPSTPTPETPYQPKPEKETEAQPEAPTYPTSSSIYAPPQETSDVAPTGGYSSKPPAIITSTSVVNAPAPSSKPVVTVSGAGNLIVSSSVLLGALAVGVALLA